MNKNMIAAAALLAALCAAGASLSAKAAVRGDINSDGRVDTFDLILCRKGVVNMFSGGQIASSTYIDGDGNTQVNDLVLLSQYILGEKKELPQAAVTTAETTTSEPPVTTSTTQNGDSYMKKMATDIHMHEEPSVLETRGEVDYGTIEKKTYFSKDAQREKNLNVLLPPSYDASQSYPVFLYFTAFSAMKTPWSARI